MASPKVVSAVIVFKIVSLDVVFMYYIIILNWFFSPITTKIIALWVTLTVCIMFLWLESANKLVCCCSLVKYWHLLSPSCRAARTSQFCKPQSLPPGHIQTLLKNNPHHIYTKGAEMWILAGSMWLVPDPFCGLEELRKKLSWCPCSHGLLGVTPRASPHYWVGEMCVSVAGGWDLSLSLMVLACYKQVILRVSLPPSAWERSSQAIVSPVRYPGVLLGSGSSVLPLLLPGGFSLSSCFALWKIDSGADD